MLYILGLGLRGVSSLSLQEKDILSKCEHIFFETYTSVSPSQTIDQLSTMLNREVKRAGREDVENPVALLSLSSKHDVCLLVTGDPLSATTHNQLRVDAQQAGINVTVIENASVLSVIPGKLGLFPYKMGPPVSLPFPDDNFLPRSVCQKIKFNRDSGFHTMVLLDLREGRTMYSFEAVEVLLRMEEKHAIGAVSRSDVICAAIKVSQEGEKIICDRSENILDLRLEESPATLVIPGSLNHNEEYFLSKFAKKCHYFR